MQSDQNSTAEITVKGACLQAPESLLQLLHLACRKSKLLRTFRPPHNSHCQFQHISSSSCYLLTPPLFQYFNDASLLIKTLYSPLAYIRLLPFTSLGVFAIYCVWMLEGKTEKRTEPCVTPKVAVSSILKTPLGVCTHTPEGIAHVTALSAFPMQHQQLHLFAALLMLSH